MVMINPCSLAVKLDAVEPCSIIVGEEDIWIIMKFAI